MNGKYSEKVMFHTKCKMFWFEMMGYVAWNLSQTVGNTYKKHLEKQIQ